MVAFAPTVPNPNVAPTSDPEYTSYRWSRPIGAFEGNKSTAIAVEGGAKALTEGVNAADTLVKNTIEQGIQKEGDAFVDAKTKSLEGTLSALRGEGSQAYASADANAATDPKKKLDILSDDGKASAAPTEVQGIGPSLDKLAARRANGSISQTQFDGDIAAAASKWRAKWPGYVKEIDAEFDRVTQRGSANVYIQSMVRDLDVANAAAKEGRSKVESLLQHAQEVDHIPGSDKWDMLYKAGKVDEAWVRHQYNTSMLGKYKEEQAKTEWGTTEATDKNRQALAERAYNHNVSNTIANVVTTIEAAKNPDKVAQEVRDNKIDAATAAQLSTYYTSIITQAEAAANKEMFNTKDKDGNTMYDNLGAEKAKAAFNDNPRIKLLRSTIEMLNGKQDAGVALLSHNMLEGHIRDEQWKLASGDSLESNTFKALKVWAGTGVEGKIVSGLLEQNGLAGALSRWSVNQQVWGGAQAEKKLTGDDAALVTFKSSYDEAIKNGQSNPTAFKNLADQVSQKIADPKIPDALKEGWMEMAYDGKNLELSIEQDHYDPATGKKVKGAVWFYQNLTSEQHAAEVARVAKSSGHPELWDKYQNYVEKAGEYLIGKEVEKPAFKTNPEFIDKVGKILAPVKEAIGRGITSYEGSRAEPENNFKFSYDNEANKFYVRPANKGSVGDRAYFLRQQKLMEDSVTNINTIIKSVSSMSKVSGQDPNVYLYNTLAPLAATEPSVKKMLDALIAAHQETQTP